MSRDLHDAGAAAGCPRRPMRLPSQILRSRVRQGWLETILFAVLSVALAIWGHPIWSMVDACVAALALAGTLKCHAMLESPLIYMLDLEVLMEELRQDILAQGGDIPMQDR